ncbi:MAG TPA: DUF2795 domain-containing protein [Nitrososphaera sp.]|nr:DUF2795 domain-containing protein [Nitrososphaera sp.]
MSDKYVGESRHKPTLDASRINRAVERGSKDSSFIDESVAILKELQFPAFKHSIVEYARRTGAPDDAVALFESLDGYMEYRDPYHVQKSLEENRTFEKKQHQVTEATRTGPDVRTRPTDAGGSIKEREAANPHEERKDYPEVTPTAMSNFVCDRCGKPFQNQQDMLRHQQFESGTSVT